MSFSHWHRRDLANTHPDVLIVGAGISGLSAAFWLRRHQPDLRVAVVDRGRVGSGASGRNAGFMTCGSIAHFDRHVERLGVDTALSLWNLTRDNHEALLREGLLDEACDYRRTGAYSLSRDGARLEKLAAAAQTLAAHGQEVRRLGPTELPLPGFAGGYWYAGDGQLDPVRLLSSLRRRCGASILEGVHVQGLDPGADRVLVRTDLGELCASNVVLATNAYTPDLCDALAPWVRPVRAQALATAPVSLRLPGPIYALDDWAYLRQDSEARVILGGFRPLAAEEEIGTEDHLHPAVHGALDGFIERHVSPACTSPARAELRWSGALGYAPDALPVIGEVPGLPGVHFVGAHSGHGMGWGFVAGRMLAALLTEGTRPGPLDARRLTA